MCSLDWVFKGQYHFSHTQKWKQVSEINGHFHASQISVCLLNINKPPQEQRLSMDSVDSWASSWRVIGITRNGMKILFCRTFFTAYSLIFPRNIVFTSSSGRVFKMDFNYLSIMQKSVCLGIRKETKIGGKKAMIKKCSEK